MRSLILTIVCMFFSGFCLFAQDTEPKLQIAIPEGATPWNHLDINADDAQFQIAIVTDRTGGHRPGVFAEGVARVNLLQPEFVMSVGDLIEGYTTDEVELKRQWDEFDGFIEELQMPFFYVAGNHDYTNPVMAEMWEDRLGPSYYHFTYKDVLFLCVNSERAVADGGPNTYLDDAQFEYFKEVLAENTDVKWTLLFMHKPMWVYDETGRWNDLEALLANRQHTVFAGHQHHYVKYERNNGKYIMLATTGGGSGLRGARIGEFDHFVWLTMTEQGPILANLMLEGVWNEDIVTEEQWDFVGPLRRQIPMRLSPVILEKDEFTAATTQLRITNDSDAPMMAKITVQGNVDMDAAFYEWEKEIAPNSVEMVDLALEADESLATDKLSAMNIHGDYTYMPENLPIIEFMSEHKLKPVMPAPVAASTTAKTIDGKVDDWDAFDMLVGEEAFVEADKFSHKGISDGSFAFSISYDEEYLYLVAKVTDDELINNPGSSIWNQDGMAFVLDARPTDISANETDARSAIYIWQTPDTDAGEGQLYRSDRMPSSIQHQAKMTEGGFIAEVAIPHAFLDSIQGKNWEYLRVNAVQIDSDEQNMHRSFISWAPRWESEENYIGSGMFRRIPAMAANEEDAEGGEK